MRLAGSFIRALSSLRASRSSGCSRSSSSMLASTLGLLAGTPPALRGADTGQFYMPAPKLAPTVHWRGQAGRIPSTPGFAPGSCCLQGHWGLLQLASYIAFTPKATAHHRPKSASHPSSVVVSKPCCDSYAPAEEHPKVGRYSMLTHSQLHPYSSCMHVGRMSLWHEVRCANL